MRFLSVRELHDQTPRVILKAFHGENFIITRKGKPHAFLLPLCDDEIEEIVLNSPRFLKEIKRSKAEYKRKGGITLTEALRRLKTGKRAGS